MRAHVVAEDGIGCTCTRTRLAPPRANTLAILLELRFGRESTQCQYVVPHIYRHTQKVVYP